MLYGPPLTGHCRSAAKSASGARKRASFTRKIVSTRLDEVRPHRRYDPDEFPRRHGADGLLSFGTEMGVVGFPVFVTCVDFEAALGPELFGLPQRERIQVHHGNVFL